MVFILFNYRTHIQIEVVSEEQFDMWMLDLCNCGGVPCLSMQNRVASESH